MTGRVVFCGPLPAETGPVSFEFAVDEPAGVLAVTRPRRVRVRSRGAVGVLRRHDRTKRVAGVRLPDGVRLRRRARDVPARGAGAPLPLGGVAPRAAGPFTVRDGDRLPDLGGAVYLR